MATGEEVADRPETFSVIKSKLFRKESKKPTQICIILHRQPKMWMSTYKAL